MVTLASRLRRFVVEHLGVEPDKVTEAASFIDDLGADSLDTVELRHGVRGGVRLRDADGHAAETIWMVGDAVKFARKRTPRADDFAGGA